MKLTDWEIADIIEKEKHLDGEDKNEWLDLFDYNYDPLQDNGWPWYGTGRKHLIETAQEWLHEHDIFLGVITAVEEHESGEQYVWTFREYPNVAV